MDLKFIDEEENASKSSVNLVLDFLFVNGYICVLDLLILLRITCLVIISFFLVVEWAYYGFRKFSGSSKNLGGFSFILHI